MSSQFQSVILTISKVVAAGKAMMEDVRAVEEQGIPMVSLLDEYLGGDDSRTVISTGGISATTFVSVLANYVGNIGKPVIPDKDVEWAEDDQDEPHNQQVFTRMTNDIVNRQIQFVHDDYQALIDEDALKARVARVRKALLDEGVHPPYHRRQVERLRQEWPTMYRAIMDLVNP